MHGSRHENQQLIADLIDKLPAQLNCEVLVCTPFVYLQEVEQPSPPADWEDSDTKGSAKDKKGRKKAKGKIGGPAEQL